jgi:FkbM family methyltransferase
MRILFFVVLILFLLYLKEINLKENFITKINFKLYNLKNKLIQNNKYESSEQKTLYKFLKKNDNILQLGGNIGTSCIFADKILKKNNINICVEPNSKVIPTLEKNKKKNKSNFTITHGIISEKKNQKIKDLTLGYKNNYLGSHISPDGNLHIKSYSLYKIKNYKKINVLFADCEGCLEKFFNEYKDFINQLRLIIYEKDWKSICNYDNIEKILLEKKFKNIKNEREEVWIKE